MNFMKRKLIIVSFVLAAAMLGTGASLAIATSLTADPTGANGRVFACYNRSGALRVISPGSSCGRGTAISWVGTSLNAVVFSDGTLLHGSGVSQITHQPGSGLYDVYFNDQQAGACAQVASLADMTPGTITAYGGQVASNVVQVQTSDTSGNSADRTFQVILSC
jgi:hypothetical protein